MCAMPKGHKPKGGYCSPSSISGADNYETIANKCTDLGYTMSTSSARNTFLYAMMKIANSVQKSNHLTLNEKELYDIARNAQFQKSVAEILKDN